MNILVSRWVFFKNSVTGTFGPNSCGTLGEGSGVCEDVAKAGVVEDGRTFALRSIRGEFFRMSGVRLSGGKTCSES